MAAHDIRDDKNNNKMRNFLTQGSMTHKYHNTIITHLLRIHSMKKTETNSRQKFWEIVRKLEVISQRPHARQ